MKNQTPAVTAVLFLLLLAAIPARANNYYFSSLTGNDNYTSTQAQNAATPWRSLAKLNSFFSSLRPGDSILLKSNEVFNGAIIITASGSAGAPIVIGGYGTGAQPVINGCTTLNSWTQVATGIWETSNSLSIPMVQNVLLNGAAQPIGRYPNANAANGGYHTIESTANNNTITDSLLAKDPDWTGGEIVIRKNRWVLDRNTITQKSGNTITYNTESGYWSSAHYGYFIQNHQATLDAEGEWYYNTDTKKLGIFLGSHQPDEFVIEASTAETLITISNQSNIVFEDLCFKGSNQSCFSLNNAPNISILNCTVLFNGGSAVNASQSDYLSIENSTFNHTNNIALNLTNCSHVQLRKNMIKNTGAVAGMGKGDSGSYEAILISGNSNLVELNTIDSTGYIPVTFSGNDVVVKNNLIQNFAFVKDDGGGIYTWNNSENAPTNSGRKITGNIVLNGIGATAGTDNPTQILVHGIYIDDNADHIDITGNTVADCGHFGIYLHNAHEITVDGNTLYNNGEQIGMEHDNLAPSSPVRNVATTNNIFFSKTAAQPVAAYKSNGADLADFGTWSRNYYCRPMDDEMVINTLYQNNNVYNWPSYDVDGWKAAYGKDAGSQKTAVTILPYKVHQVIGNNLYSNGNFSSNINGLYMYAAAGNTYTEWSNNGLLDGGALKAGFTFVTGTTQRASMIIGIGSVTANKKYLVKFSVAGGNENKNMEMFLRKSLSPYNDLSERKLAKIKGTRTEREFLFIATGTESNASLVIDIDEQANPLYFDNLQVFEVNATLTNPADSIQLVYNASSSAREKLLDGVYKDAKNISYAGTITLAPYASAVLIKKLSVALPLPLSFISFSGKKWSNYIDLSWTINTDEQPQNFIIERSADGQHFSSIGTMPAGESFTYKFTDEKPLADKNYYRIQAQSATGHVTTKIISVNMAAQDIGDIIIGPNPTTDKLHISINGANPGASGYWTLQSNNGSLLKRAGFSLAQSAEVDLSGLSKGTYIISLVYNNEVIQKKIVKL